MKYPLLLALALALSLSGCGHKGKLKTPAEAEQLAAKKQNKTAAPLQVEQLTNTENQLPTLLPSSSDNGAQ